MSDTRLELQEGKYLDDNDLRTCSECGADVPKSEITTDLGDDVCAECHSKTAKRCVECFGICGSWYGTETAAGFICDDCQRDRIRNRKEARAS